MGDQQTELSFHEMHMTRCPLESVEVGNLHIIFSAQRLSGDFSFSPKRHVKILPTMQMENLSQHVKC